MLSEPRLVGLQQPEYLSGRPIDGWNGNDGARLIIWEDLRCDLREGLVAYLRDPHPQWLPRTRSQYQP
ncbi:hypothetical protein ABZ403_08370 [Micromonospora zamorensis]|uniref:hypothetical protein n=1 Tax=Micromonospora zamorensis TaxID=709883 RepID=UPI0033CCFB48